MNFTAHTNRGFSLVKLMVLIGLVFTLTSIGFVRVMDDSIRTKVDQSLVQVNTAKQALLRTCQHRSDAVISENSDAGFAFFESMYIADVRISGDCASGKMEIYLKTQNTGADISPELIFMGNSNYLPEAKENVAWNCHLRKGERSHVPEHCRSRSTS